MEKLSKLIKIFGYVDYAVSAGFLAYGVWALSWLYAAAGLLGCFIAYLKPAERLKQHLGTKFIKKQSGHAQPALSARAAESVAAAAHPTRGYVPRARYDSADYFFAYADSSSSERNRVYNPRDAFATLAPALRLRLGVRAEKIVSR